MSNYFDTCLSSHWKVYTRNGALGLSDEGLSVIMCSRFSVVDVRVLIICGVTGLLFLFVPSKSFYAYSMSTLCTILYYEDDDKNNN